MHVGMDWTKCQSKSGASDSSSGQKDQVDQGSSIALVAEAVVRMQGIGEAENWLWY